MSLSKISRTSYTLLGLVCGGLLLAITGCSDEDHGVTGNDQNLTASEPVAEDEWCGVVRCKPGTTSLGGACGGRAMAPCAHGLDCIFNVEADCGSTDRAGTCQKAPMICSADIPLVCGCDGKTYNNECQAHAAGVSVKKPGAC